MSWLSRLFGDANARALKQLAPLVEAINKHEKQLESLHDDRLREETVALRRYVREHPGQEQDILDRAFALVREGAKRTLKQRHYDVQLLGGIVLHQGKIAEMRTGEGKTLVATLPIYLNALSGNGVHLVTVNDYLAKRDTVWMGQVYHVLGLTVGCIQHEQAFLYEPNAHDTPDDLLRNLRPVSRKEAYAADITYGTNNEFGFDYLRDNMVADLAERVQRGHAFAIVDEVDSILIDEARTPLIISAPAEQPAERYYQFAQLVSRLEENADYNVDEKMRAATLTQEGIAKLEQWLGINNIYEAEGVETVHHIEQALKARTLFLRDRDYVVKEGEVIIVDEFTGRLMFGRRFSEGLHQAIEAKENVQIKEESVTMATITFQNYFRMYTKLSGMTGTASTEAEEFAKIYNLDTVTVPTNRPMVREDVPDRVYKNERGKYAAIVSRIRELHEKGQPVLVGTISIEKNELVSDFLKEAGIPHQLLNAKNHEREAKIIADAGRKGAVTLATNIAGRGVDIILGGVPYEQQLGEEVRALGGLFVLGTERHEARRIDNQLRGRSGRQGDPGGSQFYVSLEDDLLRIFGSNRMGAVMERLGLPDDMPIENSMVSRAIESAQRRVEGHNFDIRKHLVEYDDVINKHREVIYTRRDRVLAHAQSKQRLRELIEPMIEQEIERVVSFHTSSDLGSEWNMDEIYEVVSTIFPIDLHARLKLEEFRAKLGDKLHDANGRESIVQHLIGLAKKAYDDLETRVKDPAIMGLIEKNILLRSIDTLWVEHLDHMEHLRRGIGLRGYGQRDPLVEYKKEAYELFHQLNANVDEQVVYSIFKVGVGPAAQARPAKLRMVAPNPTVTSFSGLAPTDQPQEQQPAPVQAKPKTAEGKKIGRNDPCPCGSGKKYKKCGMLDTPEHQKRVAATTA
ncbi:MAG: preprotein translocase subunit SecA [Candidatus Kerfeldbacteria bacterium]|nr:preprotein translocase subunit SecA [Candidatus Kerfeldbacteria bacterium]